MPVLFAVIPVYDEPHTLALCVANIMAVRFPAQWSVKVIVVDDASGSDTANVASELAQLYQGANSQFQLLTHAVNLGKGAALRTGFAAALQQAGEQAHKGAFARTIGADHRVALARAHGKIQTAKDLQSAKGHGQTTGFQNQGLAHAPPPRRARQRFHQAWLPGKMPDGKKVTISTSNRPIQKYQ